MSEELQKELNELKTNFNYLRAKLMAGEQFTNNMLRDLMESKTTLNLYSESLAELNSQKLELEEELKKLKIENEYMRNELNGMKENAQPT